MSVTKIKVLYIIDTLEFYGAERSLVSLVKEFKNTIPVFVHIYPGSTLKEELNESGIQVYSLEINEKYGFKKAVRLLTEIYRIEKPDLVHSTLFRADMISRKMKVAFKTIPLVNSWVTNSYKENRYKNHHIITRLKLWRAFLMDYFSTHKVDKFLANSRTIEKANRLALNISQEKTEIIYRGRDFSKFQGIPESKLNFLKKELHVEGKKVLLNVGRLIYTKGQLELIQAMPRLIEKYPNVILIIVGEGSYRKTLEAEIYSNEIEKHVFLLGARNDIPELLGIADIFVFPSHMEGLSGALIEAMMAGKLIIASDIPENLECVNSNTALIFNKEKKDDLLFQLEYALKNQSIHQVLAKNAQEVAQNKFEISKIASMYEKFYKEVKDF
jgi:glycosyltransferase involved in cell wall biosynthesis